MKHEPKTMKKKADLMLKRGTISDKQHKKLHAKADAELSKMKGGKNGKIVPDSDADELSATGGTSDDGAGAPPGATADPTQTPTKRAAATKKPVLRGQPLDEEERDL